MASKRSLYTPVPRQNLTSSDRRPLSQGKLLARSTNESLSPHSMRNNIEAKENKTRDSAQKRTVRPKITNGNDQSLKPRKNVPLVSQSMSPRRARRVKELELSDSDNDQSFCSSAALRTSLIMHSTPPDVLVVNASRKTKSPDTAEVDIQLIFAPSPVKVVCHTPNAVEGNLRNTGDVELNRQVTVSQVPKVSVTSKTDYSDISQPKTPLYKRPQVIPEKTIAGSPQDPNSSAKNVCIFDDGSVISPIHEMELRKKQYLKSNVPDVVISDASDLERKSDAESTLVNPPSAKSFSVSTASHSKPTTAKKKRVCKEVQSRYMQMAMSKAVGRDESMLSNISSTSQGNRGDFLDRSKRRLKQNISTASESSVNLSDVSSCSSIGEKPSRPYPFEVSAISNISSGDEEMFPPPKLSYPRPAKARSTPSRSAKKPKSGLVTGHGRKDVTSSALEHTDHMLGGKIKSLKKPDHKVNQQDLDVEFSRCVQWYYLDAMLEHSMKMQQKKFMAETATLANINEQKRKRIFEVQQQIDKQRHLLGLDRTIELQRQCLGPVVNSVSKVTSQHSILAQALDTTRHQIPVHGIYMPDNTEEYEATLMKTIVESERLMAEVISMIPKQKDIKELSDAVDALDHTTSDETKKLENCQELLAAMKTLSTHEMSLKIQRIQEHET